MRKWSELVHCAAAALAVAGCDTTGPEGRGQLQHQLSTQRQSWSSNGALSYTMRIERNCTCANAYDVRLDVVDGELVAGESAFSGTPLDAEELAEMLTLTDLFDVVEQALDANVPSIAVQYHPQIGYVRHLYIDYDARRTDDDVEFTVTEYTPDDTT